MRRWLISAFLCLISGWSLAQTARPVAEDPVLEARMMALATELRCLVCQNQSLADSHATLAIDLKNQVREQLKAGRSDAQVIEYMTQRYGDFVLYRPPVKATTLLLWAGPLLLLIAGSLALWRLLGAGSRRSPEAPLPADEAAQATALLEAKPSPEH